jgi:ATP-dependent helicase HepA
MLHAVLNKSTQALQSVLAKALPEISTDWWKSCVIDRLTFSQNRIVEEKGITSLSGLDLSALLRITDQNWSELSRLWRLPFEVRNWLKEAQTIRNRWAHLPPGGLPPNDVFRDADTIFRLMSGLGADEDCVALADEVRTQAASQLQTPMESRQVSPTSNESLSINKGEIVRLKARSECTGAVVGILDGAGEIRYQVFHDGKIAIYYESQIEPVELEIATPAVDVTTLHAALTSLQLCHPSTSSLYSLFASRIHFVPYQFRPVLKLILLILLS